MINTYQKIKETIETVIRDNIKMILNEDNSYYYALNEEDVRKIINEIMEKM